MLAGLVMWTLSITFLIVFLLFSPRGLVLKPPVGLVQCFRAACGVVSCEQLVCMNLVSPGLGVVTLADIFKSFGFPVCSLAVMSCLETRFS